jgi:hypothetical protein
VISGEPWANVFWTLLGGGVTATQADLVTWNTAFRAAYVADLAPLIPTSTTITTTTSTLFQSAETALHAVNSTGAAGTLPDTPVKDTSASKVISWTTNVYWRGGKPRTYIPNVGQTETTDGRHILPGTLTQIAAAGNSFRAAVNAIIAGSITSTQFGFVSFRSGGADRPTPVFFPILGAAAHPRIGTQRGRLGAWTP